VSVTTSSRNSGEGSAGSACSALAGRVGSPGSNRRCYGYAHQMAFYRALLAEAIGIYQPVYFVAVEKKEPYRCGVWQLTSDTLAQAHQENERTIERLKRCLATDTWPTGYEECRVFDAL
jgi:hypothetical protein